MKKIIYVAILFIVFTWCMEAQVIDTTQADKVVITLPDGIIKDYIQKKEGATWKAWLRNFILSEYKSWDIGIVQDEKEYIYERYGKLDATKKQAIQDILNSK